MNEPVKIIALNGSPHRSGNTSTLMGWVADGAAQAGASVEWIHLVDYRINYCLGCNACLQKGVCPQQDDFLEIRSRLMAADGYIIGSPVYEGGPSAQLKTLFDRLTLLGLFTLTFEGKWSAGVATSGVAPTRGVAKQIAEYCGFCSGTVGATTATVKYGYRRLEEHHPKGLPDRARKLGQKLVRDTQAASVPGLRQLRWQWIRFLHNHFVRPLVQNNPDQFGGVLQVWKEKGWN